MFVRRTGTHRAHTDIAEVATRRVRRLGGLDPPPADRRRAPAADRPDGGGARQQARMVAAVHGPPRGGWVPARPEPGRPRGPAQHGQEQQGQEQQGPEGSQGPKRPQGSDSLALGSESLALGRDSPAPSREQVASTEVTVHELRALAAARDKRDKIADRLPVRLGLTGGHVAIIALVLVVAIVAASALVWRSRPVASAVSGPVSPVGSTAAARPPVDDPDKQAGTSPAMGGSGDTAAGGSGDTAAGGSDEASQASGASATASRPATAPATVIVHVAGKVARPGVVAVAGGARVEDAIEAAGGALPGVDLRTVNLARQVTDGEQVLVGFPPEEGARPSAGSSGGVPGGSSETSETEAGDGQPIDLNSATLAQLETLPGVGPVLAQRLLDHRAEHGGFAAVDELLDVSGIGEVTFAELEPLVTVG